MLDRVEVFPIIHAQLLPQAILAESLVTAILPLSYRIDDLSTRTHRIIGCLRRSGLHVNALKLPFRACIKRGLPKSYYIANFRLPSCLLPFLFSLLGESTSIQFVLERSSRKIGVIIVDPVLLLWLPIVSLKVQEPRQVLLRSVCSSDILIPLMDLMGLLIYLVFHLSEQMCAVLNGRSHYCHDGLVQLSQKPGA